MVKNFSSGKVKIRTHNFGILYDLVFFFCTRAVGTSTCLQQTVLTIKTKFASHMDCFGMAAFRQLDLTAATLATHLSMCVCFCGRHGFLSA